ncbi:hypothetical protein ZWY2020_055331 [Hordeum vulgare]|nr:hypothetical protein ZWY2020_055331 [Hordeum vulgare]
MPQHLDTHTRFKVMDLIVETIRRTSVDQKRSCRYAPYIQMLINAKIGKHAYYLDHPHLPLQPEFEDNEVLMNDTHPSSATAREAQEAAAVEAAKNAPAPPPQLKTTQELMSFLFSTIRGTEKNISEILLNQKSLERIVETKFHDLDVKVTELTTTVKQLQHEVDSVQTPRLDDDDDSPLCTTTRFLTHTMSADVPIQEDRPSSLAQASTPRLHHL